MSRIHVAPLTLAIAVALHVAAGAAQAQATRKAPVSDARTLDAVIVTGTRASGRTALESTAPIDVLDGEDLRRAGVLNGELGSALQALLPSLNFPRQSNSGGADHVRPAQLRGLAPDQVLVLVNGKRRHVSALVSTDSKIGRGTTPVDLNAIPVSAIRRIEVLRDGAGALYGSDAVAGVINILLDDRPEGGRVDASFGAHRTDVGAIDRKITDGQTTTASAQIGTVLGGDGFLRTGVEVNRREPTNRAGFDQIPFFEDQTPANLALRGRRNFVLGDGESKRVSGWFNAGLPVGESGALYAFGTYQQSDTEGANFFRYPDGPANLRSVYPNGYRPVSAGENLDVAGVAGLRARAGAWDIDASLNLGRNDFTYRLRNSLNASLGTASPTQFRVGDYRFEQGLFNLDASRVVERGPVAHTLALGAEFRREAYETGAGDPASYAAGPLTTRPTGAQAGGGLTPQDVADLSRDVATLYANVSTDWGNAWTTDAGLRYEDDSDFGGELTGKLAARIALDDMVALRGSASRNFRAPSLSQIGFEATSTGYDASGRLLQGRLLSVNNRIARGLGAQALDPEAALNVSLGVTLQLGSGFDASFDIFRIDVDDRVALSERITGPALTTFVQTSFGIAGVQSVNFFVNAADLRTQGAELVANWQGRAVGGDLRLNVAWSYAETEIERLADTPAVLRTLVPGYRVIGVEESNTLTDAAPRTRAVLTANWARGGWSLLGRATRHGSATRVFDFGGGFEPRQTYGAEWQLDAEVAYAISDAWTVAVGGQNLTDNYADRSIDDIAYFGNLPYDVLSPIGSNGAFWYGRVSWTF